LKIEENSLINRHSELDHFKKKAEEIAQGRGEDLFFISPRGRGKTVLLKKLKEVLFWGQEEVIPVYFSFSRGYIDQLDFAEEYLVSVLSQILLFDQKERIASQRQSPFSFSDLKREAERQGLDLIEEIVFVHQRAVRAKDERKGLLSALAAPGRIAQASNKPVWMMVDHIQAIEAFSISGKGIAGLWRDAIASPWAPHLFSGEPPGYLLKNLIPFFEPPNIAIMELAPFPEAEEEELSQFLGKTFKVRIAGDLSRTWFLYLESNPGLLTSLLRDARLETPGLESHQRFVEVYLKSLWQGELGRLFENRLYDFSGRDLWDGHLFLKILHQLLKSGKTGLALADLAKTIDWSSKKGQWLIRVMEQAGLIWERFGNIGLESNRVLRDWVQVMVRKHLRGEDLGQLIKQLGKEIEEGFSKFKEGEESAFPTCGTALQFNLVLPINSDSELVAVRALEQIATYSDLDATSVEKIKVALIEACINAGEHSQSFEKKIRIYFSVQPEVIEIWVEDRGQAFDPVAVQARIVREEPPFSKKRGRGFTLIKEMMDEVRFEKAEVGTRLYMAKKIDKRL
jgi:anti-sigma regulatory factor (Ser/Thr protein kinase)